MSSSTRQRKDRSSTSGLSEEQQLWHTVRSHVRAFDKLQSASTIDLVTLETRRARFLEEASKNGLAEIDENSIEGGPELRSAYRKLETAYQQEQQEISRAVEKIELLLALRDENASVGGESTGKRRKRRADGRSVSPTPSVHTNRAYSPTLSGDTTAAELGVDSRDRKRSGGKANAQSGIGASSGSAGATNRRLTSTNSFSSASGLGGRDSAYSADSGHVDPARARREVLAHQLPLKKGRKVAFRQPNKTKLGGQTPSSGNPFSSSSGTRASSSAAAAAAAAAAASAQASNSAFDVAAGAEEEGETWIMATVIECINNDKNRYVVQDEEDDGMPTYNTTLKAIVPLPDHPRTLPSEDYKPGTHVLGLYPDTSCFYRAIVRGGGPGLGGRSNKKSRKPDELLNATYHLEFEDDDGAIRDVPASLVVERP